MNQRGDKGLFNESEAVGLMGGWLSAQLSGESLSGAQWGRDILTQLPQHSAGERLALVRAVLEDRPALNQAVRRLSLEHQLTLTLEVLHGTVSPHRHAEYMASAPAPASYLLPRSKRHDVVYPRERTAWCAAQNRGRVRRQGGR
jgi:hypothetical protein